MIVVRLDELAAGGDAVGRDEGGRVTFVPRGAPGDLASLALTKQTKTFARGDLVEIIEPSPSRVTPPCASFVAGCGGCQWQHIARGAQHAAKQTIVEKALRKVGVTVHPLEAPTQHYHWRRRARFHVEQGRIGLYAEGSHRLVPLAECMQLEPALDAVLRAIGKRALPYDGELTMIVGAQGEVVVGVPRDARRHAAFIGMAGIVGVVAQDGSYLDRRDVALDDGLRCGPWDFAQATALGNRALRDRAVAALGPGPGRLLELHAGAGNLSRAYAAAGWEVIPSDVVMPTHPPPNFIVGAADAVVRQTLGTFDAIALDPPRTGAAEALAGIVARAPQTIVYVSCDPATLARDAEKLVAGGYRATDAWPIDLMPQTSHVEVVLKLVAGTR